MITAMSLKIAALTLLLMLAQTPSIPEDLRTQATAVANQALAEAARLESTTSTSDASSNSPSQNTSPSPAPVVNTPVSPAPINNASTPMPESKAKIDIISPIPGKGLGRTYASSTEIMDETNYIEIGAVVYDDNGDPTNQPTVTITATDTQQNKTLQGTGNVTPIYVDGNKRVVPVYAFHYEFKTSGEHTITFAANGKTQSVTVNVQ